MKKKSVLTAILAALPIIAFSNANAAVLTLSATPKSYSDAGAFTITFDDVNGDNLLEFDEIQTFSGIEALLGHDLHVFTEILTVGRVSGFAINSGASYPYQNWVFSNDEFGASSFGASQWTYEFVGASEVPLPAALPLFLAGFAGVAGAARRRKS